MLATYFSSKIAVKTAEPPGVGEKLRNKMKLNYNPMTG